MSVVRAAVGTIIILYLIVLIVGIKLHKGDCRRSEEERAELEEYSRLCDDDCYMCDLQKKCDRSLAK